MTIYHIPPLFGGSTYDPTKDAKRLGDQLAKVRTLMVDGQWRTLYEIAEQVNAPEQSVSARLRDLRKPHCGSLKVERRRRTVGTFEYRVATTNKGNNDNRTNQHV